MKRIRLKYLLGSSVLMTALVSCSRFDSESSSSLRQVLPVPACGQMSQLDAFNTQLVICNPQQAFATTLANLCLTKLSQQFSAFSDDCKENVRSKLQHAGHKLLVNAISNIKVLNPGLDDQSLKNAFSVIATWYEKFSPAVYRDFYARGKIKQLYDGEVSFDESMALFSSNLWNRINKAQDTLVVGTPLYSNSFEIVEKVLKTAFQSGQGSVEIVMQILVDSLMPLNERVTIFTEIYDLACALQKCGSGTAIRELVALNSSLADPETLNATLNSTQALPSAITKVFRVIAENAGSLKSSLSADPNPTASNVLPGLGTDYLLSISSMRLEEIPAHLKSFVGFVRKYKSLQQNLLTTGFFSGKDSFAIENGLNSKALTAVINRNQVVVQRMKDGLAQYSQDKTKLLSDLRQTIENNVQSIDNSYAIKSTNTQIGQLTHDIQGLKLALEDSKSRFAGYLAQLEKAQDSGGLAFFDKKPLGNENEIFTVSPKQAKYSGAGMVDVPAMAFKKLALKNGEFLQTSVSGQWAPLCALKKSPYASGLNLNGVRVGPGGFVVARSAGQSEVRSLEKAHRDTEYFEYGVSAKACAGFEYSVGVKVSAEACAHVAWGKRTDISKTKSKTSSSQINENAAFYAGVHLDNTPFSEYPAGSLLAFMLPQGETSLAKAVSVDVVSQQSTVFAPSDVDVYFVVNDCVDEVVSPDVLTVNMNKVAAKHASAKSVLTTMLDATKSIEQEAEKALSTGAFSSKILQNKKSKIISDLTANGTITPDFYQFPVMRDLFAYWIDNEIIQAEMKSQLIMLGRQLDIVALEAEKHEKVKENIELMRQVVEAQLQHASMNADLYVLLDPLHRMIAYSSKTVVPMVNLHFPKILNDLPNVQELVGKIDEPLDNVAKTLMKTLEVMTERLNDEYSIRFQQNQTMYLMLRLPRPDLFGSVSSSIIPVADFARSKAVWDSMVYGTANSSVARLMVTESDLYKPALSSGRLTCSQVKPVVTDMMMVFAAKPSEYDEDTQLQTWNERQLSIHSEFGRDLMFPSVKGPLRYRILDPDVGSSSLALGFVSSTHLEKAQKLLQNKLYAEGSGVGMSPFATLEFGNFEGITNIFKYQEGCSDCLKPDAFTDIVMAYKVEVSNVSSGNQIKWVSACGGEP